MFDLRPAVIAALLTTSAAAPVALTAAAQSGTTRLTFEVAAIKRNVSGEAEGRLAMQPGGHFRAINFDVRTLIAFAYRTERRNLMPSQIIGAPEWLERERYDIVANVGPELVALAPTDPFQTPKLVQSLLEDRFRLVVRREKRDMPVYELVRAGTLGPQLTPVHADCVNDRAKCGVRLLPGLFDAGAYEIDALNSLLSNLTERLVINRTGLTGQFAVHLEWSPDQAASDKPSIFTSVQEQLGLKLESAREPVDVVVIDHIERPSED